MRNFLVLSLVACGADPSLSSSAAPLSETQSVTACDSSTHPVPAVCADQGFAPDSPTQEFRSLKNRIVANSGAPHHRALDQIARPGDAQNVIGKIEYGVLRTDLKNENVEVWAQDLSCATWTKLGNTTTTDGTQPDFAGEQDDGGQVFFTIPSPLPLGDYRIRLLVKGDHSTADMWLRVWPAGTPVVVADIDGTMTTKENDGLWAVFNADAADPQPAAPELMQAYFAKGYRIIFLTARPEFMTAGTRQWFAEKGFPDASFHFSQTDFGEHGAAAQTYKYGYLQTLTMPVAHAYGNKDTDLGAYIQDGISPITLIAGQYTGDLKGATMVQDYVDETKTVGCLKPLP